MAEPRREWLKFIAEVIAATGGVRLGGVPGAGTSNVLPYNAAALEGLANG
jgi:hypothetical protein